MNMTIVALRRAVRRSTTLVLLAAIPLYLLGLWAIEPDRSAVPGGIVDLDRTESSEALIDRLARNLGPVRLVNTNDITVGLISAEIHYAVVIPSGFSAALHTDAPLPVEVVAVRSEEILRRVAEALQPESSPGAVESAVALPAASAVRALGILLLLMMILAWLNALDICDDRHRLILNRMLCAPKGLRSYTAHYLTALGLLSTAQALLALTALALTHRLPPDRLARLMVVLLLFAALSAALSVAIVARTRRARSASLVASFIVVPAAMLGGSFWPREMMPALLQRVSLLVPTAWADEMIHHVLAGGRLSHIAVFAGMMVLATLGLVLLGPWTRRDIGRMPSTRPFAS